MAQPFSLIAIADDLVLCNTQYTQKQFLDVINKSIFWLYEWGIIFAIENELHIHILSHYRKKVFLRKPLREVAFFMFKKYFIIKTSVLKNKENSFQLWLRVGWKLVNETPDKWNLEATKEDFRYA